MVAYLRNWANAFPQFLSHATVGRVNLHLVTHKGLDFRDDYTELTTFSALALGFPATVYLFLSFLNH